MDRWSHEETDELQILEDEDLDLNEAICRFT